MGLDYYKIIRNEIQPLFSGEYDTVLEVGCAAGYTLEWLKKNGVCKNTVGIEYHQGASEEAKNRVDTVYCGDVGVVYSEIPENSVDLLLCLDVLEHLVDPWTITKKLYTLVKPGGTIIISLPNVRYWKVSLPLIFNDSWEYADSGVLDKTHLRFFVYKTAVELLEQAGFVIDKVISTGLGRSARSQFFNNLLPAKIINLISFQYLIKGVKK